MIASIQKVTSRYGTSVPGHMHLITQRYAALYIAHGGAFFRHPTLLNMRARIQQPMLEMMERPQGQRLNRARLILGVVTQSVTDNALMLPIILGVSYLICRGKIDSAVTFTQNNIGIIYGSVGWIGFVLALASKVFISTPLPVLMMRGDPFGF